MISDAVSKAYDILVAAGVPLEQAAQIAVVSEREWKAGRSRRDPVAFALHFVNLRKVVTK